jgi:hypothetical protein
MTAARQKRKREKGKRLCGCLTVLAGFLLALSTGAPKTIAATTERVVMDWNSGLAIGGYDPVAFFTDGRPLAGSADFELRHGGAIWRFRNIGNRSAFAAKPEIYMPQFGGYDPLGVLRGVAVAGNPNVWLITGERLYLFYDRSRLETFAGDAERLGAEAARKWPDVERVLSP